MDTAPLIPATTDQQNAPSDAESGAYGRLVITGAANDSLIATALVYIAAFGLDEGESIEGLSKQGPAPAGAAQIRPDDHGFLWINRDGFAQAFAAELLRQHPRLRLERFPSYAPQLNPDEGVWTLTKHDLANGWPRDLDDLMEDLTHTIERTRTSSKRLRGCVFQSDLPPFLRRSLHYLCRDQ